MAGQAMGMKPTGDRPTKYYFAYGSNLHLKQMKRRCPNSKYIGRARLLNYRWQINERGYANVIPLEGHWVDGLVYEIDKVDEAKLDINEGVSKNAYTKQYLDVNLYRADSALYRRPTSWIVDKGGPAKIVRQARDPGNHKPTEADAHWVQEVLVYISETYIQDSDPKDEYVNRINFGLNDARALGMEADYITNCIRPSIPPRKAASTAGQSAASKGKSSLAEAKSGASQKTGETPLAGKEALPENDPDARTTRKTPKRRPKADPTTKTLSETPPPLPPRPTRRGEDDTTVVVEESRDYRKK